MANSQEDKTITISTEPSPLSYAGDGTTTAFAITWKYFAKSHVVATLRDSSGSETTWVLDTDYTLTGADVNSGGTLTAITIPASGETLLIDLDPPNTQSSSLPLGGAFPSPAVEDGIDLLTQLAARNEFLWNRTLRVPRTDNITGDDLEMPIDSDRAGKYMAFTASGKPSYTEGTGTDNTLRSDLASIDDGTKGFHLVSFPPLLGEPTVTDAEYKYGNALRYGVVDDDSTDNTALMSTIIAGLPANWVLKIPQKVQWDYYLLSTAAKAALDDNDITLVDYSRSLFDTAPAIFVSKHFAVTGDIDMWNPGGSGSEHGWIEQDGDHVKTLSLITHTYANDKVVVKVGFKRLGEVQISTGALTTVDRATGNTTDFSTIVSSGDSVRIEHGTYIVTGSPTSSQFSITANYTGSLDVDVFAHKTGLNEAIAFKAGDVPETVLANSLTVEGRNDQGAQGNATFIMRTWATAPGFEDRFKYETDSAGNVRFYTQNTAGSAWVDCLGIFPGDTPTLNFQNAEFAGSFTFDAITRALQFSDKSRLSAYAGDPEGNQSSPPGTICLNTNNPAGSGEYTHYHKQTGSGNTGYEGIGTIIP